jgi:hypothetical protein
VQRKFLIGVVAVSLSAYIPASAQQIAPQTASSSMLSAGLLSGEGSVANPSVRTPASATRPRILGVALGVTVGTLGVGAEAAVPLAEHFNLRGGANFFSYSDTLSSSGVNYTGTLRLRSGEAELDWFPWARGFHISPGVLLYNGNQLTGAALIPGGDTFTLNDTTYMSDPSDPVHGSGSVKFTKAAPKLTIGWGNLLPRSGRRFAFPFEVGFAYQGDPKVALDFIGTACDASGQNCVPIATDPTTQANVAAQEKKVENDATYARFYPILSTGFSFRF